ncbi:tRNA lysidine(34) synthetase TilS [Mesorhizobium sp. INR15]|uniref:tRNA lysidine(34) synthetase TilS n=1 Tax=Mesorhizobium sp. INR15 TaxID=2654248 RepID=UPI0018966FCF|nr:tRNA lysidine(34) synthetase TilS [Mesorhizobium sp. INR15]QPC90408.1 tRNA lysidine(34) synthetase TilS [Mesorhizobium sp. INR15]
MLDTEPSLSKSLFSHIDFTNGAVAAVSGGSDSTALLLLLKTHLDLTAPATRLLAVTIDHGLRPDAAAEAQAVASLCAERGIPHRILAWSGSKPSTGLPAAAREARYRLLAEAARAEGIGLILTGHTADDQAETVLMRQTRDGVGGDEARGLAGMAPATLYDWRCWIARPLLATRREMLRDYLRRRHVGWAEDPTNEDATFERPRIRAALAGGGDTARADDAMALSARAAAERVELGHIAAGLIRDFASQPVTGLVCLAPGFLASGEDRAAIYALRILLATIGGLAFLPEQARGEALFCRLRGGFLCATLSRTVVDFRRAGIFLHREARGLPSPAALVDGALWDGRRKITMSDSHGALLIAPLGAVAAAKRATQEGDTPASLVRAALAMEPALWVDGENQGLAADSPTSRIMEVLPVVGPFARFLPSFDLAPAHAVAELIGAAAVPPLPFSGHTAG